MYLKIIKLQYLFHGIEDKKRIRIRAKIDAGERSSYDQEACVLNVIVMYSVVRVHLCL